MDINQPCHIKLQYNEASQWEERVREAGNRVRDSLYSHCYESHMKTKLHSCTICTEGLSQSHAGWFVIHSLTLTFTRPLYLRQHLMWFREPQTCYVAENDPPDPGILGMCHYVLILNTVLKP